MVLVRVDKDRCGICCQRTCSPSCSLSLYSVFFSPFLHPSLTQCCLHAHREALAQVSLANVLHSSLERRQAVVQVVLGGITEVKVLDVAQIRHPEKKKLYKVVTNQMWLRSGYKWVYEYMNKSLSVPSSNKQVLHCNTKASTLTVSKRSFVAKVTAVCYNNWLIVQQSLAP